MVQIQFHKIMTGFRRVIEMSLVGQMAIASTLYLVLVDLRESGLDQLALEGLVDLGHNQSTQEAVMHSIHLEVAVRETAYLAAEVEDHLLHSIIQQIQVLVIAQVVTQIHLAQ